MVGCCVTGCDTTAQEDVIYFEFPTSRLLKRRWLDAIKPTSKIDTNSKVCSAHFGKHDYERVRGKVRLKGKVVPSIFNHIITQTSPEQNLPDSTPKTDDPDKTVTVAEGTAKVAQETEEVIQNNGKQVCKETTETTTEVTPDTVGVAQHTAKVTQETSEVLPQNTSKAVSEDTSKAVTEDNVQKISKTIQNKSKDATKVAEPPIVMTDANKVVEGATKEVSKENSLKLTHCTATSKAVTQENTIVINSPNKLMREPSNRSTYNVDRIINNTPSIDINKDDIEDILTNYHIKQTKPLHRMFAESERASGGHAAVIEISETEDRAPVFIEVAVKGDQATQSAAGEADGNDCLMVLESVQVELDPSALMLPDRESEDSDVEVKDVEPAKKTEPISLLTSSDEDEVIIQEPHIDTIVVPDETDEDDVPLVKLVKPTKREKKMTKKRASDPKNRMENNISQIMWGVYEYFCMQCHYTTTNRAEYKRHTASHSTVLHICPLCSYTTASKLQFARHKRKHKEEKKFKCHICDYKARHNMSLIYHLKSHDIGNISRAKTGYKCDKCGFKSDVKHTVLKHIRWCTTSAMKQCNKCSYKTKRQSDLKRHTMRKHKEGLDDEYVP
ncbi:zinc finger Y-chromosomal protein 1-like [Galleria mellonella]|uniref:Zinc finger Y-chromosomal protein 1-like n=1 Tax=Galleria mellonella TaxID=7137 RepID=A0ABM3MH98_GALME|nr:zinc finger Y-chromosomal protein 1-like [Galleria mellonella]